MADSDTRRLASAHDAFIKGYYDAITEENALWYTLKKKGRVEHLSGTKINYKVRKSKDATTVTDFSGMQDLTYSAVNRYQEITHNWSGYAGTVTISETDLAENEGENAVFPLMQSEEENLRSDVFELIEDHSFLDGTGGNGFRIKGLQSFIDDQASPALSYGGVTQSAANAYWQNQYLASTGTGNIIIDLLTFYKTCTRGGGNNKGSPDCIFTGRTMHSVYNYTLQNSVRYYDEDSANAGFDNLMVQGAPMYWSDSCVGKSTNTANVFYFLNTRKLRLYNCFKGDMFVPKRDHAMSPAAFIGRVISHFQLVCFSPRYQGMLDASANTYV